MDFGEVDSYRVAFYTSFEPHVAFFRTYKSTSMGSFKGLRYLKAPSEKVSTQVTCWLVPTCFS